MVFEYWHDNPPPPFNPDFVPGLGEAVSKAYREWCEQNPGSSQDERREAYQEIHARERAKRKSVGEQHADRHN